MFVMIRKRPTPNKYLCTHNTVCTIVPCYIATNVSDIVVELKTSCCLALTKSQLVSVQQ